MDNAEVKESRRLLRLVQEHLIKAHLALGAVQETVGLVEVIHHPRSPLPDLNYVTPRRNTAWVSGNFVQEGVERLHELGRTPRVCYIEGLFPPMFARTLYDLGMASESETPIMVYSPREIDGAPPTPALPDGVHIQAVDDHRGIELWWYVWRNAYYDVTTLGVEPLAVGREMESVRQGYHVDLLAYRNDFPVGVARLSLQPNLHTAHIAALALLHEARTPDMTRALQVAALREALKRGCSVVFAPGFTDAEQALCQALGFTTSGTMMRYSDKFEGAAAETDLQSAPALELIWDV